MGESFHCLLEPSNQSKRTRGALIKPLTLTSSAAPVSWYRLLSTGDRNSEVLLMGRTTNQSRQSFAAREFADCLDNVQPHYNWVLFFLIWSLVSGG